MNKVFVALVVLLTANMTHAAEPKWNHKENIRQGVKLFDAAYKQGGMVEVEKLSKDCHMNFTKSNEPQIHELCAAIDFAAMTIDSQMVPQASLQRKYFQRKTLDGRLRKELSRFGHNKNIQDTILKFWGDTATKLLNELSDESAKADNSEAQ